MPNWQELLQRRWQDLVEMLEQVPAIQNSLSEVAAATEAAQAAAEAANAAAEAAQAATNSTTAASSLANSYVTGLSVLAADAGTDAAISISTHIRVYGDGTSVAVGAGSVTGLSYSTVYYVYYDDPARVGGVVVYHATTDPTQVAQLGDRHSVATVETPAALAPDAPGRPVAPPGGYYAEP